MSTRSKSTTPRIILEEDHPKPVPVTAEESNDPAEAIGPNGIEGYDVPEDFEEPADAALPVEEAVALELIDLLAQRFDVVSRTRHAIRFTHPRGRFVLFTHKDER